MKPKQPLAPFPKTPPIIAVVVVDDAANAAPLAETLLAAGVTAIELTLRTPSAFASLKAIRAACPEMQVGLGTVLTADQVEEAADAGAAFAVAPGLNPRVVRAAAAHKLPFAPGILTPSDIETAVELGCRTLKFFPAEAAGGLNYLKSMAAPYAHLELRYIPLGGLDADNLADYLACPDIPAVGGSWIAPRNLIGDRAWSAIGENARQTVAQLSRIQSHAGKQPKAVILKT